jgi:hypothetical protein
MGFAVQAVWDRTNRPTFLWHSHEAEPQNGSAESLRLDRAIERSDRARLIEGRAVQVED